MNIGDITQFAELPTSLALIALVFLVVRYFIASTEKKDQRITQLVDSTLQTVRNHMKHSTRALNKNTKTLDEIYHYLKNLNGK